MASSAPTNTRFVYLIPIPPLIRVIVLALAPFFLCGFLFIPLRIGAGRTIESMRVDPLLWLILIGAFALPIALPLRLAFPPRSWLARLEFDRNCVRLVPKPLSRWIGEPSTELCVDAQAREILICQGSRDTYDGIFTTDQREFPYGFRVAARSADGHTRELRVATGVRLSTRGANALRDGITAATGLPVRLIKRKSSEEGVMREVTWTPSERPEHLLALAMLLFVAMPLVGGIAAGVSRMSGLTVITVGVLLWFLQTLAVLLYARRSHEKSRTAMLYWLTTAITFAASYAVVFLLTSTLLHNR